MIIMDTPRPVRFRRFCRTSHMVSTEIGAAGTAELVAFAASIGLRPAWLQKAGDATEHFDLFDAAIDRAQAAGAEVVTGRDLVLRAVAPKRAAARKGGAS